MFDVSADPGIGRTEALRRAMLALIESGDPKKVRSAYWVPFVVVGEDADTAR